MTGLEPIAFGTPYLRVRMNCADQCRVRRYDGAPRLALLQLECAADQPCRKSVMLDQCARIGFTPPESIQH